MTEQSQPPAAPGSVLQVMDRLVRYDGPTQEFLNHLMTFQCSLVNCSEAVILRLTGDGQMAVIAAFPAENLNQPPAWLNKAVEVAPQVLQQRDSMLVPMYSGDEMYGQPANDNVLVIPAPGERRPVSMAAFHIQAPDQNVLRQTVTGLELTAALFALSEWRVGVQESEQIMHRLRIAMEVLAALNEQPKFKAVAMSFCNEVSVRWGADRVSLGFLRGRYVKVQAMSHTEKFTRKMRLVQDIEAAMEETLDQDTEVVYPAVANAHYVYRATTELSERQGPLAICSVPLRFQGEPKAVLTLERAPERPFTVDEVETLRLTAELCTARLVERHDADRWFGARLAKSGGDLLGVIVGTKHAWIKATVLGVLIVAIVLCFARGTDKISASFVLETTAKRVVPVPFDGKLARVYVDKGDPVKAGQVLAELDTVELLLERSVTYSKWAAYIAEAEKAMAEGKTADQQIAMAKAEQAMTEIALLDYKIKNAKIVAPIDGVILTGEWEEKEQQPVSRGEQLFEVGPEYFSEAELAVPEDRIADVWAMLQRKGRVHDGKVLDVKEVIRLQQAQPTAETLPAGMLPENPTTLAAAAPTTLPALATTLPAIFEPDDSDLVADTMPTTVPAEQPVVGQVTVSEQVTEKTVKRISPDSDTPDGYLATASHPGVLIPFVITEIAPLAEVVEKQNVYRVQVRMLEKQDFLKPGMKGIAKIHVGNRLYVNIWTRDLINWLRMKLWL